MAKRRCLHTYTDRNDGHRTFVCQLQAAHKGAHKDGDCEWSDGSHYWGQTATGHEGLDA